MKQDEFKTKVIFRKFKEGDIIAMFPEVVANMNKAVCESYKHVGQHGACSIFISSFTKQATPEEYNDLKCELESIGYNLDIKKRYNQKYRDVLYKQIDEYYKKCS